MEDRPLGSKLLQIFDRQFALISATVMTYNIVGHQKEPDYLLYLVDELSESKYPHEIPNSFEFAAGVSGPVTCFAHAPLEDFRSTVDIHLTGTFWTSVQVQ